MAKGFEMGSDKVTRKESIMMTIMRGDLVGFTGKREGDIILIGWQFFQGVDVIFCFKCRYIL